MALLDPGCLVLGSRPRLWLACGHFVLLALLETRPCELCSSLGFAAPAAGTFVLLAMSFGWLKMEWFAMVGHDTSWYRWCRPSCTCCTLCSLCFVLGYFLGPSFLVQVVCSLLPRVIWLSHQRSDLGYASICICFWHPCIRPPGMVYRSR